MQQHRIIGEGECKLGGAQISTWYINGRIDKYAMMWIDGVTQPVHIDEEVLSCLQIFQRGKSQQV